MADLTPVQRALLETIAGPESAGSYDVIYGGSHFNDFSDHPRQPVMISSGPNKGKYSTAAGKYQFLKGTWDDQASELGLQDFSPQSQDQAAWHLAKTEYQRDTGRDLEADLTAGDLSRVAPSLRDQWTSMPGGIEQGIGGSAFANAYAGNLGQPAPTARPQGLLASLMGGARGGVNSAINAIGQQTQPIMRSAQAATQAAAPGMIMQALSTVKGRTAIGQYLMNQNIGKAPQKVGGTAPNGTLVTAINNAGASPGTLMSPAIQRGTGNSGGDPFNTTQGQNMDVYRTNAAAVSGPITQQSIDRTLSNGGTMVRLR